MSLVESQAAFRARAQTIGLPQAVIEALVNRGWGTMGAFAFACSATPGSSGPDRFWEEVGEPVLTDRRSPHLASLRRLWFESFTMSAAELRNRVERKSDDAPRKMALAEREARFGALERLLPGLILREELEPAHRLTDMFYQQAEDGVLRYVGWSECIRRDDELLSKRKDRVWRTDQNGNLREEHADKDVHADCSSDYKLRCALQRRGLAIHMAGLMTFQVHESLALLLMREHTRDPPPGYSRVTAAQLQRTDQEIFRRLADASRGILTPNPYGAMPLDALLPPVLDSATVRMLLAPLPASSSSKPQASTQADRKPPPKRARSPSPSSRPNRRQPSGKGSGKANKKVKPIALPKALAGSVHTKSGDAICFGFNTGMCKFGASCTRKHVCTKCEGSHPYVSCPSK